MGSIRPRDRDRALSPAADLISGISRAVTPQNPWKFLYSKMAARAGGARGARRSMEGRSGRCGSEHNTNDAERTQPRQSLEREIDGTNPDARSDSRETRRTNPSHVARPVRNRQNEANAKRMHAAPTQDPYSKSTKRTQGRAHGCNKKPGLEIDKTNCHATLVAPNPMKMAAGACMVAFIGPYFHRNPRASAWMWPTGQINTSNLTERSHPVADT